MKILSWNVNGIRAAGRKGFLDWFLDYAPDVLCVQEIKAMEEQIPLELRDIEGYSSFFFPALRKGYSGTGLWTASMPLRVISGMGNGEFDAEGRVQIAEYGEFTLFNVYFPNGKASPERLDFKMRFYDALFEAAEERREKGERVVICGDVNTAHKPIDLARPEANANVSGFLPEERAWIDRLLDAGYIDTFRRFDPSPDKYTWWDYKTGARERNVGWRIDYFFADPALSGNLKDAFILPGVVGSDHCPVGIELQF